MCASGMLTKIANLSLIVLTQSMLIKKMSVSYAMLIKFSVEFLLRSQAKWVIFQEYLYYHFHESTSLAIFTKNELSRTEKKKKFLLLFGSPKI